MSPSIIRVTNGPDKLDLLHRSPTPCDLDTPDGVIGPLGVDQFDKKVRRLPVINGKKRMIGC